MKYFTFYRESGKFDDIIKDTALSKHFTTKIQWYQHLYIGIDEHTSGEEVLSYLMLKFSDDLVNGGLCRDRTPVEGRDYTATRRPKKA